MSHLTPLLLFGIKYFKGKISLTGNPESDRHGIGIRSFDFNI